MIIYIFGLIIFIWLILLSIIIYKTRQHYFNLVNRTKKYRLDEVLEKLINQAENNNKKIEEIQKTLNEIKIKSTSYYQKLGFIKFNPFGRTEGEKSFVLALLDGMNSGLVVNFIYTHEGIRIYSKKVKNGSGEEYKLSDEENLAIEKAR